jgi:hypothetical protein
MPGTYGVLELVALFASLLPAARTAAEIRSDRFGDVFPGHRAKEITWKANRGALEQAAKKFNENGIEHGEIDELLMGLLVLTSHDPDNIQMTRKTQPTCDGWPL